MCGRFSFAALAKDVEKRFGIIVHGLGNTARFNCAPTQNLAVITNLEPEKLNYFRWGLIPFWAKDIKIGNKLINTKAETIDQKPSFKNSFKRKRCLIPADGFYEWNKAKEKIPYRIILKNNELFSMAGIWDKWKDQDGEEINSFSIITTSPNELVNKIHNRMPVILHQEDEKTWLENNDPLELKILLKPFPAEKMEAYPISKLINSPLNDFAEVIEPIK